MRQFLQRLQWSGEPVYQDDLFRVAKGTQLAVCRLFSHPDGWELRLEINGERARAEVCPTQDAVFSTMEEWQELLAKQGWRRRSNEWGPKSEKVLVPKDFSKLTEQLRDARTRAGGPAADHMLTIQQQLEAIQRGDLDAALRQAREDIVLEIFAPKRFPFITRTHGIQELRQALEHNFAAVADQKPTVVNVMTQGDVLVLLGSEVGTIRKTGEGYHVQTVHRFTFIDRTLAHIQIIAADAA